MLEHRCRPIQQSFKNTCVSLPLPTRHLSYGKFIKYHSLALRDLTSFKIDFHNEEKEAESTCEDEPYWGFAFSPKRASQRAKVGYAPTPTCVCMWCRKWDFLAKMGSKLLNSCEPARPADTNTAPKVRLCAYLFAVDSFHCQIRMTNTQTPPPATTVVNTTGAPVTNTLANHAQRPEKFNETVPQVEPPAEGLSSNAQTVQAVEAWKHSDFLCHNYVLKGLIYPLYNVYCKTTSPKNYGSRWNASTNKECCVVSQVQDLHVFLHDIHAEGMTLSETFQVAAIIEKLLPSWVEFKNYLKHKRKEISVEDLVGSIFVLKRTTSSSEKDTYTPDSARLIWFELAGSSQAEVSRDLATTVTSLTPCLLNADPEAVNPLKGKYGTNHGVEDDTGGNLKLC
ncbi:hypothetical protein Tco_0363521 [Tanacetum coccineum]